MVFSVESGHPSLLTNDYWTGHQGRVTVLKNVPEHGLLLTAGADAQIRAWNLDSQSLHFTILDAQDAVTSIVFNEGQDVFFASSLDGAVRSWTWNGQLSGEISLGTPIMALAINETNGLLAAAGADSVIYMIDTDLRYVTARFPSNYLPRTIAFLSPQRLAVGSESGHLDLWDLDRQSGVVIQAHSGYRIKGILPLWERNEFLTLGNDAVIWSWPLSFFDLQNKACARFTSDNAQIWTNEEWSTAFGFSMPPSPCKESVAEQPDPWRLHVASKPANFVLHGLPPIIYYFEPVHHYVWGADLAKTRVRLHWATDNVVAVYLETYHRVRGELTQTTREPVGSPLEVERTIDADTVFRLVVEAPDGHVWYRTVNVKLRD